MGKEETNRFLQYEVSMTINVGRKTDQRKIPNVYHLKTVSQNH